MKTLKQLQCLQGRTVLVTGAAGMLGRTIVSTIIEMGADLILIDRPGAFATSSDTKNQSLAKIQNIECDLEDPLDRSFVLKLIAKEYSKIDVLINNAAFVGSSALGGWTEPFEEQTVETWRRALEVNLTAIFDFSQNLYPIIAASGNGSIINIGSIYGVVAPDFSIYSGTKMGNPAAYAVSKGGLITLTRWLASSLAPEVRVNAISPGGIYNNQHESFVSKYVKKTPLGRMAKTEDFKGMVAFLSSDLSAYVTGQNFMIDGGFSIR